MKLVGIIAFVLIAVIAVGVLVAYATRASRYMTNLERLTDEYNNNISKAAFHSRKGHTGESNVYFESAQRIADLIETEQRSNNASVDKHH